MPKKIIVFVQDYPFYKGEPFFHLELKELVLHAEQVMVVPRHIPNRPDEPPHFALPEGVKVFNVPVKGGLKAKLVALLCLLFPKNFKRFWNDLKSKGLLFNILSIKTALMYDAQVLELSVELKRWFKQENEDSKDWVFYSYWCDDAAYLIAQWKAKGLIARSLTRAHGADLYEQRHPNHYLPYRNFIMKHLDVVACISQHGQRHFWERFPRYSSKFVLARLGVLPQTPLQADLEFPFRLLSLSSIDRVKHLELLIEALAEWKGSPIEWHHLGNGRNEAYEKQIKDLAETLLKGKPEVRYFFHGFVNPSKVISTISELKPHALINCSFFEGIPVSMMEAASLGIPLLGGAVGGVPELLLDQENGFLFEPGNKKELLEALSQMSQMSKEDYAGMCQASFLVHMKRFNALHNYYSFSHLLFNKTEAFDKSHVRRLADSETVGKPAKVGIIHAGMGNVEAVQSMLRKLKVPSQLVSHPDDLDLFETLYLPGVGSFDKAMEKLNDAGLSAGIKRFASKGGQVIGICLGMQLLFEGSEEGNLAGLGLLPGISVRIPQKPDGPQVKVPHIGWSKVYPAPGHEDDGFPENMHLYFTHSYTVRPENPEHVLLYTNYPEPLVAAVRYQNIYGYQFHPEKSHTFGLALLRRIHQPQPQG